jgi:AraC-like DNA-binding protein
MLIKFPVLQKEQSLITTDIPFARYRQETLIDKRSCFVREHMILFVLKGHKLIHMPGETLKVSPGNILILKRGFYLMSEFVEEGLNYEAFLVFFTDEFLKKFLHQHGLTTDATTARSNYFPLPANELLEAFKMQYLQYFSQPLEGLEAIMQLKLQELFLLLLAGPQRTELLAFLQSFVYATPLDIGFVVREHLFQPLTLEELAKLSGRSLASFKRDFQQLYQCAPRKWINEQRLAHARTLLEHTGKQVAEVALECGYENVPHFVRMFRRKPKMQFFEPEALPVALFLLLALQVNSP